MKKLNNYHRIGLLLIAINLSSSEFSILPDVLNGFCLGAGTALTLIGVYAYNHDMSKIRNYKIKLLKKCFGK
ncbi:MAG: hypothetical protein LIR50_08285 [Bacillota bacterium]|nr:hypothetical protein [Bacillota bacterium]